MRKRIAWMLAVLMLAMAVTGCSVSPEDETTGADETTEATETTGEAESTQEETEAESLSVTVEETTAGDEIEETTTALSAHDRFLLQMDYNVDELAEQVAVIASLRGLKVTYYEDMTLTREVRRDRVRTVNESFHIGDGISGAVYEGFICFDTDGTHTLTFDGGRMNEMFLWYGDHHMNRQLEQLTVEVKAGTWYAIRLQTIWPGDRSDLSYSLKCDGKTDGFTVTVAYPYIDHAPVTVEPLFDTPMRDCYVYAGPDGNYYMTGTSGPDFWDNTYNIHVYRSADLEEWEDLGVVWDFERDATWAKTITNDSRRPVWAPEIAYINGNWYLTYSLGFNDGYYGGILVSTSGRPEGPYTDTSDGPIANYIDLSLFQDDDGTVYLVYRDGLIAPLNEDLSATTADFVPLYGADGLPVGFEGCSILKHDGKYYLTAADYNDVYDEQGNVSITYDAIIAVSDTLMGPYSRPRLLLRNGGHNNLFVDFNGNVWTTLFAPTGNLGFQQRPAILPLQMDDRGLLFLR